MMNQTLADIRFLEKQLDELNMDVKHKATLYSKNSDEVIEASKILKTQLIHPNSDLKECYWFIYKSPINSKISIRVKGPII